jgi:hypothetical protein
MAQPAYSDHPEKTVNLKTAQETAFAWARLKFTVPAKSAKPVERPQQLRVSKEVQL